MTKSAKLAEATRREVLKFGGVAVGAAAGLAMPFVKRARAEPVEINMLAWYGHGEPDMVEEFEAENNVKFKPKYYAGGDNMLALIAQSPPGTYDIILSDAEFVQQLNAAGYIEEMAPGDYDFDDMLYDDLYIKGVANRWVKLKDDLGRKAWVVKKDIEASGLFAPIAGHVGDGNFHVGFMVETDEDYAKYSEINETMVMRALAMGGTCTGEHGIGYGKMDFLQAEHGDAVAVMRQLKIALDPDNIMNPGKVVRV